MRQSDSKSVQPQSEQAAKSGRELANPAPPGGDSSVTEMQNGKARVREIGGRKGPEPTRFGDWEKNGRCIDF